MEMDMFPFVPLLVPDAGLLERRRLRPGIAHALDQPNVTDDGYLADNADMRLRHRHQPRPGSATELKVELVERHPLHQIATRFRLEARERGIAKLLIRGPILPADRIEQPLRELQQMRCF